MAEGKRSQSPDLKKSESADSESAFLDEPAAVPKRKYKTVVKSVVYNDPSKVILKEEVLANVISQFFWS